METANLKTEEKIARQTEVVKNLADEYKKNPSAELHLKLNRATDVLRHITNVAQENASERGRKSAEFANRTALNRAIEFSE